MDSEEKRIIRGVVFLIIGIIVVLVMIYPIISIFTSPYFSIITITSIDTMILGVALILIGVFSLKPVKTDEARKGLGMTSIIFGAVLSILPLIFTVIELADAGAYFFVYLLSYAPSIGLYLIFGVILIVHGAFLIRRVKNPERKIE